MASRRKPPKYRDGGAVASDSVIMPDSSAVAPSADELAAPPVAASADVPPPQPAASERSVADELAAIRRAEEMQREMVQPRQPQTVAEYVDTLPVSARQKQFLKTYPMLMRPDVVQHANKAYLAAKAAGLRDDTEEQENFVLEKTGEALRRLRAPPPESEYRKKLASDLERELAEMGDTAPPPAPRPMAPPQRSVPISAPVSRNIPSASGSTVPMRITLSPEERDMARRSYQDLPPEAAERLYSDMKRKMLIARANGTLNE
jgi:hypothetical protein